MGFLDPLLLLVERIIAPLLRPIQPLIRLVTDFYHSTTNILTDAKTLVDTAVEDYEKIRNFSLKPHWKSRVISVPDAIQRIQSLAKVPHEIAAAVRDLVQQIKSKVNTGGTEAEALEDLEGMEDLQNIIRKFGLKFAKGFERVLGIFALIVDALASIESAIADIQTILDDLGEVIDDLDSLDIVFLSQKNPRRTVSLKDGGSIRERIGNLHS